MVAMPAKRPTRPATPVPAKDGDETTEMVGARVPAWIKQRLQIIAKKNRRTVATEILIAIEDRLKALGEWPPDHP